MCFANKHNVVAAACSYSKYTEFIKRQAENETFVRFFQEYLRHGTTTNFSWISANSAATSGSSNTDSCRRDIVLLSTETRLFTKDITDLNDSDRVLTSTSSFLAQRRAYSSTESKINLEFCFQVKDLGSLYLGPLERMSLSLLILTILRSPVMM